jgi:hypothetical protein
MDELKANLQMLKTLQEIEDAFRENEISLLDELQDGSFEVHLAQPDDGIQDAIRRGVEMVEEEMFFKGEKR